MAKGEPTAEEMELAERLFAEWDGGRGTSKSRIEVREWGDASSHGRHFDRFIRHCCIEPHHPAPGIR